MKQFDHDASSYNEYYGWRPTGEYYYSGFQRLTTYPQAVWNIRSNVSHLALDITSYWYRQYFEHPGQDEYLFLVLLIDSTAAKKLLRLNASNGSWFDEWKLNHFEFNVDPSHEYQFIVSGGSDVWTDDVANLNLSAKFTSAPEPSTLMLLGLGLVGLAAWKMRRK